MLDIRLIREDPDLVRAALSRRGVTDVPLDEIIKLDEENRRIITEVEVLRSERNTLDTGDYSIRDLEH